MLLALFVGGYAKEVVTSLCLRVMCFSLAFTTLLFCPGNLGFLDFLLGFLSSRLPVVAGSSEWFALALLFSLDGFMVRTSCPSIS